MTHQASEMTRFYVSEMARRVEMHSPQFCSNNFLTHQQFHLVSTFRNLLSIINLFARILTSVFDAPRHFGKQEKAPEQRETGQFFFKTTGFTQPSMVDRILNL